PVCGMDVDPHKTPHHYQHEGKTYYFCNPRCMEKFRADPQAYLGERPKVEMPVAPGTKYTCPMHPEIVRDQPDSCPICGMALEPMGVSREEGPNPELVDMSR